MGLSFTTGWAILDTETTHFEPGVGEIIEIAILREDGGIFTTRIKPQHIETAHPKALEVNGYNEADWEDAPEPLEAAHMITPMLLKQVIVGQNISFDMDHLKMFYHRLGLDDTFKEFDHRHIDTMTLAYEHLVPHGLTSLALYQACKFLRIDNEGAHGALRDVERTREVFLRLCRPNLWDRHVGFRYCGMRYRLNRWRKEATKWLQQGGGAK